MFAPPAFSVRVLAVPSDRVRLVVGGELDLATGPALRDALAAELDAGRDVTPRSCHRRCAACWT
jgi:hypothetical protein